MVPPPRYYLHNYRQLLDWVMVRYADVLTETEQAYYNTFVALPNSSQALLVRMITRKGEYFRLSKLHYAEIGDAAAALAALPAAWLQRNPTLEITQVFNLLTRAELTRWLGRYAGTKADWLAEIAARWPEPRAWRTWFTAPALPADDALAADVVQIRIMPESTVFQWLFFGNRHQSLSEFVLTDLGIFTYEPVAFSHHCRSFHNREELAFYQKLSALAERAEAGEPAAELLANVVALQRPEAVPHLLRRYDRLLFKLAYRCEQAGDLALALNAYRRIALAESRPRAARVLEKLSQVQEAYAWVTAALADPVNEAERQQLQRMQPRLARKLARLVPEPTATKAAPARAPIPVQACCLPAAGRRVEQAVADFLQTEQAPVLWAENYLWTSLFGLICWPAIFAPLPGAFFHPFQVGPQDLHQPEFYTRRRALFEQCIGAVASTGFKAAMVARYRDKHGVQSPFVHWQWLTEDVLQLALECLPSRLLQQVCARVAFDVQANRAGFPDLIQFYPGRNQFRLIEVKGPGDTLQDNQVRWLNFFLTQGVDASVMHVTWQSEAG